MANNDTITLKFTSNTASLDKGFKDVQQGARQTETALNGVSQESKDLGESLERAGKSARSSRELFRGLGDASVLMGGEVGAATQNLVLMSAVSKDVSRGMGGLLQQVGILRLGLIGLAIAGTAAAVSATSQNKGWSNLKQDGFKPAAAQLSILDGVVQKMPGHLGPLGGAIDSITDKLRINAGMSHTAAAAAKEAADAALAAWHVQSMITASRQGGYDTSDGDFGVNVQGITDELSQEAYDQKVADAAASAASTRSAGVASRSASSAAKAAMDAAKAAAKQKLSEWQSVVDQARQVGLDIAKALAPKLDPTFNSQNALLSQRKGGVIAGLQDQLRKMKELSRDVDKLAKMGLAPDLLQQIVAAGPDGLDSARELLQGNNVATANSLDKQINKYANHIATGESTREFNNQPKQQKLLVDIQGGEREFKAMVRKWIRVDGGGDVQLALGGK